jgi:predicted ester cyclase
MGATRDLLEHSISAWERHDRDAWVGDFNSSAELSAPGGVKGSGTELINMLYSTWQDAFPDNQLRIVNIAEDGPTAVLEAVFEGTHTAPLNAPSGSIPATGKRVSIPYVVVDRVEGGKFTLLALYFDQAELLTQLGLMPAPAAAGA